jgi:hypothetical protein
VAVAAVAAAGSFRFEEHATRRARSGCTRCLWVRMHFLLANAAARAASAHAPQFPEMKVAAEEQSNTPDQQKEENVRLRCDRRGRQAKGMRVWGMQYWQGLWLQGTGRGCRSRLNEAACVPLLLLLHTAAAGASCTSPPRAERCIPRCCCRRELQASGGGAAGEHEPGETLSGMSDNIKDTLQDALHNRGP